MADFDLAIIGGGINGAGIARDAAGRGFRVVLIEQNDLASGTSSASSKLIHGGLALSRAWRSSAWCACGAARARSAVARGAASDPAAALRVADQRGAALGDAAAARPPDLRSGSAGARFCRARASSISSPMKPDCRSNRAFHHAFEYSDCFADDCAPRRAQRGRCRRARRGDPYPHPLHARRARRRMAARAQ